MYTREDLAAINQKIKGFVIGIVLYSLISLAFIIWGVTGRNLLFTIIISALWVVPVLFFWNMAGIALITYRRYLQEILEGRSSIQFGLWKSAEKVPVQKEGLSFWRVCLKMDEAERLFYYDCQKEYPLFQEGEKVMLRSYQNFVVEINHNG